MAKYIYPAVFAPEWETGDEVRTIENTIPVTRVLLNDLLTFFSSVFLMMSVVFRQKYHPYSYHRSLTQKQKKYNTKLYLDKYCN